MLRKPDHLRQGRVASDPARQCWLDGPLWRTVPVVRRSFKRRRKASGYRFLCYRFTSMSRAALCVSLLGVLLAGPASAAELRLEMSGGFVTLVATDTPLRQILAEWARVGGTRIVNAERIAGPPVTIQLERVPEQEALAVLLRSAAGYLAAPRRAGSAGASVYESVMILATSTPPAAAPAPATGARGPGNPIGRPVPSQVEMLGPQQLMPDGDDQIMSEGFITVGSAPAPRQTPAAGAAGAAATGGPTASPFPRVPVAGTRAPAQQPPGFPPSMTTPDGLPRPGVPPGPPGIVLPNDGTRPETNDDQP